MKSAVLALIESQRAEHPYAGPEELALYVAQATPAGDLREFYRDVLIGACRSVINRGRRGSYRPKSRPRVKPRPSPKLEERRSWWASMLAVEMHLADGVRKVLGDCTVDDVRFCIKDREEHIEAVQSQIANLDRIAALMIEHGVTTVRELPEQTQLRAVS